MNNILKNGFFVINVLLFTLVYLLFVDGQKVSKAGNTASKYFMLPDSIQGKEVLTFCEKMPEFKGGKEALSKYIIENVTYPKLSNNDSWQSFVRLTFIIDTKGKTRNVGVLEKLVQDYSPIEKECIKMIENMPLWKPGEQNGLKVPVVVELPIHLDPNQ